MSPAPDPVEAVSQRLAAFVARQSEATAELGAEAAAFVDAAAAALGGGKRLRARFCVTGWRAVEQTRSDGAADVPESVVAAAAALEVFQAAALVHDDLIDNSDTRRGRPAAHRALEAAHRGSGWHGDAAAFGRSGAILLGDLLVAWSDDLFEEAVTALGGPAGTPARREYARMRREVTIGQFLDIAEESAYTTRPDELHAERALRIASLKSARYSIQQPLVIGAALAGADDDQQRSLRAFGHPLGMAFQLRDDVLGVFGDAAVTGKPSGDDLREGKRTVLVAFAREALPERQRRELDERLGDPRLGESEIAALQRTIVDSGALERVEELIAGYARDADAALAGARLGESAVAELRDLARAATSRTA